MIETFLETKVHASIRIGGQDPKVTASIEGDIDGVILLKVGDGRVETPEVLDMPVAVARHLPRMFEALIARAELAGLLGAENEFSLTNQKLAVGEVA